MVYDIHTHTYTKHTDTLIHRHFVASVGFLFLFFSLYRSSSHRRRRYDPSLSISFGKCNLPSEYMYFAVDRRAWGKSRNRTRFATIYRVHSCNACWCGWFSMNETEIVIEATEEGNRWDGGGFNA